MMKHEFEELLGTTINDKDYEKIEFVYNWHPSISDTTGKQQIVDLYKLGGMAVIEGMTEAATFTKHIENQKQELQEKIYCLNSRLTDIKKGRIDFERCLAEVEKYYDSSESLDDFNKLIKVYVVPKYSMPQIQRAKSVLGIK